MTTGGSGAAKQGVPDRSRGKRPTDLNSLAKSITDDATDPQPDPELTPERAAARLLGSKGGKKGGNARAEKLTAKQRSEIAKKAAAARWEAAQSLGRRPLLFPRSGM